MKPALGLAAAISLAAISPAQASGDAQKGQALVKTRCGACHAVSPDNVKRPGPPLRGVSGRKAASAPGFTYSNALKASNLTWTSAQLDQFLASPAKQVPGTLMMVAVPNAKERADIVAYLSTLKK